MGKRYEFLQRNGAEFDCQTPYGPFWAESHSIGDMKSTIKHLFVKQLEFWIDIVLISKMFSENYW